MIRTQIQLSEGQARALKKLAQKAGVSVAALMRTAADKLIEEGAQGRGFGAGLQVAGKYSSGAHNIATEHDHYLDQAWDN